MSNLDKNPDNENIEEVDELLRAKIRRAYGGVRMDEASKQRILQSLKAMQKSQQESNVSASPRQNSIVTFENAQRQASAKRKASAHRRIATIVAGAAACVTLAFSFGLLILSSDGEVDSSSVESTLLFNKTSDNPAETSAPANTNQQADNNTSQQQQANGDTNQQNMAENGVANGVTNTDVPADGGGAVASPDTALGDTDSNTTNSTTSSSTADQQSSITTTLSTGEMLKIEKDDAGQPVAVDETIVNNKEPIETTTAIDNASGEEISVAIYEAPTVSTGYVMQIETGTLKGLCLSAVRVDPSEQESQNSTNADSSADESRDDTESSADETIDESSEDESYLTDADASLSSEIDEATTDSVPQFILD